LFPISDLVDGKRVQEDTTIIYGGARISYIFNENFMKRVHQFNAFDGLDESDIRIAILNANATRPALYVAEHAFDALVRRQIARLKSPGLQCLELIAEEVQRMVFQSETTALKRFPELRDKAMELVFNLLRDCKKPANDMIANLVEIELSYINTNHPDFIKNRTASRQQAAAQQQLQASQSSTATANAETTNGNAGIAANPSGSNQPPIPPTSAENNKGFLGSFPGNRNLQQQQGYQVPLQQQPQFQNQPQVSQSPFQQVPRTPSSIVGDVRLDSVPEQLTLAPQPTDRER
jgi:dynamin 1-like protein